MYLLVLGQAAQFEYAKPFYSIEDLDDKKSP